MTQYRAEQVVAINGWDCGTEIELKVVVTFKVHPARKATMIDPAEEAQAEVIEVHFFEIKGGKPSPDECSMPVWLFNRLTEGNAFYDWLMSEASEQHEAAIEDAADAKMMEGGAA
jgi:hypothetical protein